MSKRLRNSAIQADALHQWHLIEAFQRRLAPLCQQLDLPPTFKEPRRKLQISHYLSLFLLGLINPVVRSMRALCQASHLEKVQNQVCHRSVSLGSFSEIQEAIDPSLLHAIFSQLCNEVHSREQLPPLAQIKDRRWLLVDSTLWEALPRMHWALWRKQGVSQSAVRLHVALHLLDDKPVQATITNGRGCERKTWKENWVPGDAYVGDRYYGEDYKLFAELDAIDCAFVLRLREQAVMEIDQEIGRASCRERV